MWIRNRPHVGVVDQVRSQEEETGYEGGDHQFFMRLAVPGPDVVIAQAQEQGTEAVEHRIQSRQISQRQ